MERGAEDPLRVRRSHALEALVDHLADEHLDVAGFDARVERVRAATSAEEIERALDGLPGRTGR
jgi:hypothetical protein